MAIVGLGITEMGKVYGKTATGFAADAIALALADAGLTKADVDGLLIHSNASTEMNPMLQMSLGFTDLTLINAMSAFGSTSGGMIHYAAAAIEAGQAEVVVLVYADAPLQAGRRRPARRTPARGARRAWAACTAPTACSAPTTATPWPPAGTCTCTARRASSSVPSPWPSASGR